MKLVSVNSIRSLPITLHYNLTLCGKDNALVGKKKNNGNEEGKKIRCKKEQRGE